MTIYDFEGDAEFLRDEVLPKKKFFIFDMYSTLALRRDFREGAKEFLESYLQEKVICTDARDIHIFSDLYQLDIMNYFREVYFDKHLRRAPELTEEDIYRLQSRTYTQEYHFMRNPNMPKQYEAIANLHGFRWGEAIVFEDWEPNDARLQSLRIDYVLIPNEVDLNLLCGENPDVDRYKRAKEKLDNYSFKPLLPKR